MHWCVPWSLSSRDLNKYGTNQLQVKRYMHGKCECFCVTTQTYSIIRVFVLDPSTQTLLHTLHELRVAVSYT